jgi:hypothetical protein
MDIVGNLSAAIALAKRLREISSNIEAAEFKNVLADLTSELADAKLEAAEGSPPSGLKWGLYQWNGDQGLFCTACWDARKQKSRVTRVNKAGVMWMCPVCKATFGR